MVYELVRKDTLLGKMLCDTCLAVLFAFRHLLRQLSPEEVSQGFEVQVFIRLDHNLH